MNTAPARLALPSEADATGRDFGAEELALLADAIRSGTLNCTRGTMVKTLERRFAEIYGAKHCVAVPSGTAAIHCAVAALNLEPGDEVISTPITDMGAITPILYQAAIPVFADVEPGSANVTATTIAPKITRRTRAILVTHLFGGPCDMDPILALGKKHQLPVIEDAAQAMFATYRGRRAGLMGAIGCFSLQQSKHMTSGEGGLVITNDDHFARQMTLFHDKAWGYGDPKPDHYFLALNYRMTELQGAVALAQLDKVKSVVERRQAAAARLTTRLERIPGVTTPTIVDGATHVYWKYVLRLDQHVVGADVGVVASRLKERFGIFSAPRYIVKPAFACEVLRDARTFGTSGFPLRNNPFRSGEPEIEYRIEDYPGTTEALAHMLVLPWNEQYSNEHVDYIADALVACLAQ